MDEKSIEILEFPAVRNIIAGYASFPAGSERVRELAPLTDYVRIKLLLQQTAEAGRLLEIHANPSMGGASDIREMVKMAALGKMLEPSGLLDVQRTLTVMRQVRDTLENNAEEAAELWQIARNIDNFPGVEKDIGQCISPGGEVLDRASPQLASLRKRLISTRQDLHRQLEDIIRAPKWQKIIQEAIITEREGRYVIPVKTEFRRDIDGITHDVSNTGATVFVEPLPAVDLGNTIRELAAEERHEVERILQELSLKVGSYSAEISAGIGLLAELDSIFARARYARDAKAAVPNMIDNSGQPGFVRLIDARHPLLGRKAVPLDLEIGKDYSVLVITGPNTGGKTVAMKTIGLLALMAQSGIPVPASPDTCLPVFDGIFADIGDEQSIEQTLSSFSWHMSNAVRILNASSPRSLVLMDEMGASTDPSEGSALARAILLHFLALGTITVATTHYADLKAFAHNTEGIQNASFDFDPDTLAPTYHLTLGIPGGSNALATAGRLGVPEEIISRAREMLSQGAIELDDALSDIMQEKQKIETVRLELEKEKESLGVRNAELEKRLAGLREEERQARDTIIREASELNKQIRQASADLRKKASRENVDAARRTLAAMNEKLGGDDWKMPPAELPDGSPIKKGDTVKLAGYGLKGTVLSISDSRDEVEVQAGQTRIKVGKASLEKVYGGSAPQPVKTGNAGNPAPGALPATLDLRGKRAEEVEVAVDYYLNDAALTNLNEAVIIHGFGTGVVRQIVRDFLSHHPLAKSFRPGGKGEGGDGVTVVSL